MSLHLHIHPYRHICVYMCLCVQIYGDVCTYINMIYRHNEKMYVYE